MFRGQFLHTIDQKSRVSLPARIREQLEATGDMRLVMTPAPWDRCLQLHPLAQWEEVERQIADLPSNDPDIIRFRRMYIARAIDVDLDKAGRIRVTPDFRERAALEKDVIWLGVGKYLELWAAEQFEEVMKQTPEQFEAFKSKIRELIRV